MKSTTVGTLVVAFGFIVGVNVGLLVMGLHKHQQPQAQTQCVDHSEELIKAVMVAKDCRNALQDAVTEFQKCGDDLTSCTNSFGQCVEALGVEQKSHHKK